MEIKALKDICQIIAGQSPPSDTYNQEQDGMPFFQGKADFGDLYPTVRYWCNAPKKLSKPNDILFSLRAPVGPTNVNNIDACIGRGLAAIRCEDVQLKYLLHYLRGNEHKIAALGTGSTFKAVTIGTLKDLEIPLPPLEEQKKIAAILDAADNYRHKTKALIDKYDQLSQSLFLDMFGDPVTNPKGWDKSLIRNVAEAKNGYAFKSTDYLEKGVPLIRMSNFNNGPVEIKDTIKVSNVFLESRKNFILQNNDFVIALSGATTGKYGIYQHDFPSLLNQRIGLIRAKPVVSVTYLHEFLKLKSNEIFKMAAGAAQPNVSLKEIQEITIPVPPLYLQNRFATSLNNIKSQKQQAEASLVKAEDLFNSLLQRAFKGELTN
jgi:type I restriction enzyme S subunit